MPSAAGKRVGRVLAGCSKPEAEISHGLHTWQESLGFSRDPCIGQLDARSETHPESDVTQDTNMTRIRHVLIPE